MTGIQWWALCFYSAGAVFAVWGPGIAAVRIVRRYRNVKKTYKGSYGDVTRSMSTETVHGTALRDAVWGIMEFAFVGLGVLLSTAASVMLVYETSVLS